MIHAESQMYEIVKRLKNLAQWAPVRVSRIESFEEISAYTDHQLANPCTNFRRETRVFDSLALYAC